jgi:hypothetical protein
MTSGAGGDPAFEHAFARKVAGERAAASLDALDFEPGAMTVQRVLDDGET